MHRGQNPYIGYNRKTNARREESQARFSLPNSVRAAFKLTDALHPLPSGRLRAESADMLSAARSLFERMTMSADIIQLRDYQSKRDLARMEADLNRQAVEIANIAFPSVFGFEEQFSAYSEAAKAFNAIDTTQANAFHAPEKDPA